MAKTPEINSEQEILNLLYKLLKIKHQIIELGIKYRLTLMQSFTILILNEPKTTLKISSIYNCDASNVSGIIDGLRAKHLVSKKFDPNDRRIKYITLTEEGLLTRKKLLEKLSAGHFKLV
jgi:DNA-binding MarR family transcriptional regulator